MFPFQYGQPVEPVRFLGGSLGRLREFTEAARYGAGYQLDQVQRGQQPIAFNSTSSVGHGEEELRAGDDSGAFRVIYIARLPQAVFVLHAFRKKTRATVRQDIEIAMTRFAELMRDSR